MALEPSEISRLQNSLQHLRQTQTLLREDIESDPTHVDSEVKAAFEENGQVMYVPITHGALSRVHMRVIQTCTGGKNNYTQDGSHGEGDSHRETL